MSNPFAKLPFELLDEIVQLVHEECPKQYLGAVSKAFFPSSRSRLCGEAEVRGEKRFLLFKQLVTRSISIAQAVRILRLSHDDGKGDKIGESIKPKAVRELLELLVKVEEVEYDGRQEVAKVLVLPTEKSVLPHLRHLSLHLSLEYYGELLDTRNFCHLARHPRLDVLTLSVASPGVIRWRNPASFRDAGSLPADRSWWLSLRGVVATRDFFPHLISIFPCIDTLVLNDTQYSLGLDVALSPLLAAVRQPLALTTLDMRTSSWLVVSENLPAYVSANFPNLSSLQLARSTCNVTQLSNLALLPHLSRLCLSRGTQITTKEIKSLLDLPALKTLRLDLVHKPYPDFFSPSPRDYSGWTSSFTVESVGELLDFAESKGVNLVGLAVGLVKREREYEKRWGKKQG